MGGILPVAHFRFPVRPTSPYLPKNFSGSRYWDMIAAPVPDMKGSREQGVWFRFQQVACSGPDGKGNCVLHDAPLYFDTYWWARALDGRTGLTGPINASLASGFYSNLLELRRYWDAELAVEGMI